MRQRFKKLKKKVPPQILYNGSVPILPKKTEGILPMTTTRQSNLFSILELYDMQPTQKYDAIIAAINLDAIYYEVTKKSRLGAPT